MKLYINNEKMNPMSILKKNLAMNLQRSYITTTCNNKMLCDVCGLVCIQWWNRQFIAIAKNILLIKMVVNVRFD